MLQEFKKFIFRGDVIALSTGVIIGGAFGQIVTAFSDAVVKPLLAAAGGGKEVKGLGFNLLGAEGSKETYMDFGLIVSALIAFLITAAIIFFFIVKPAEAFTKRLKKEEEAAPPAPPADVVLLTEIRDALQKKA